MKSINYEISHYLIFFFLSLMSQRPKYFSRTPSIYILPLRQETKILSHIRRELRSVSLFVYFSVRVLELKLEDSELNNSKYLTNLIRSFAYF
jgi:hypothetical protein